MTRPVRWTRQQQKITLAAIDVVRELLAGGTTRGAIDAATEVAHSAYTLDDLLDLVGGLANLAAMLVEHIESTTGATTFATLRNTSEAVRNVELID